MEEKVLLKTLAAISVAAITIIGFASIHDGDPVLIGVESTPIAGSPAGVRDYSDIVFTMSGSGMEFLDTKGVHVDHWAPMVTPNGSCFPYWDCTLPNVGDFVLGREPYAADPSSPYWNGWYTRYWGVSGNPDRNLQFSVRGGPVSVTLLRAAPQNIKVYWYSGTPRIVPENLLLSGTDVPGTMVAFSPGEKFGFVVVNGEGKGFSTLWNGNQFSFFRGQPGTLPQ